MNYDLSKLDASQKQANLSPYLTYGSNQVLKINDIELKYSKNTGSPKAILHMETPPITTDGFTPLEGFKGKVGKVACGVYMKDESSKQLFLRKMLTIAIAMGIDDEIRGFKGDSFQTIVGKIADVFNKNGKFARFTVFGEEYPKMGGKYGVTLSLPRTNFVEAENADPSMLVQFDKNDPWHYKKLPEGTSIEGFHDNGTGSGGSLDSDVQDLPF
jgi:hypothetical protein